MQKKPVRVTVTGPAGQIGYAILFRIASGAMLRPDPPVIPNLLERHNPQSQSALKGVMMELSDCAFPLLAGMQAFDDPREAFRDADYALLTGARPRGPGMERSDLLEANAAIFREQGRVLNDVASRDVKVLVVGNPCNTNAWIAMKNAPDLPPENFTAMLRLDQNRAVSQLAEKTGASVTDVEHIAVWGNHSPTMYADLAHAEVAGRPAFDLVTQDWIANEFIPTVAKRGSAIIAARGASSAASAAAAAIDHGHDWARGSNGRWVTMGVPSNGAYGVPVGTVCGFPCVCENGRYRIVEGRERSEEAKERLARTVAELFNEQEAVAAFVA